MVNICYFHTEKAEAEFPKAWTNVKSLQEKYNIKFEETHTSNDFSYWEALIKYWGKDEDLIMIEQDIMVDEGKLDTLLNCPKKCCAYWFRNAPEWGTDTISIGARIANPKANMMFKYPDDELKVPPYVTFCGTGLTKIAKELQIKPLERYAEMTKGNNMQGLNTDNAIFGNINSWLEYSVLKAHVHGEVKHLHE